MEEWWRKIPVEKEKEVGAVQGRNALQRASVIITFVVHTIPIWLTSVWRAPRPPFSKSLQLRIADHC